MSSDSNMPALSDLLLSSTRYGTVLRPPVRFAISLENPARAPGQGRYSTVRSNIAQASLTFLQKGEASYSYMISVFAGLPHLDKTSLLIAKTPLPKRSTSAIAPVTAPPKFPSIIWNGFGSGTLKSEGAATFLSDLREIWCSFAYWIFINHGKLCKEDILWSSLNHGDTVSRVWSNSDGFANHEDK